MAGRTFLTACWAAEALENAFARVFEAILRIGRSEARRKIRECGMRVPILTFKKQREDQGSGVSPNVTIPRDPCADSTGHHRTERPENVDPPRHDL